LEAGAQNPRLEYLAEIALLREQPTKALLLVASGKTIRDSPRTPGAEAPAFRRREERRSFLQVLRITVAVLSVDRAAMSVRCLRYAPCE
jgi:hypothetical protein